MKERYSGVLSLTFVVDKWPKAHKSTHFGQLMGFVLVTQNFELHLFEI